MINLKIMVLDFLLVRNQTIIIELLNIYTWKSSKVTLVNSRGLYAPPQ